MQTFKQHLAEAVSTEVSTALETVLGACFKAASQNSTAKGEDVLKGYMNDKSGPFEKAKKYWASDYSKYPITDDSVWKKDKTVKKDLWRLMQFGTKVKDAVGVGGDFKGQKKGTITKEWAEWSGKKKADKTPSKDVSKTDIILGTKKCSVKNADGAQLMSGKKGESKATVEAASKSKTLLSDKLLQDIYDSIEKLEEKTTSGYYASMDNLQQLSANKDFKKFIDLALAVEKERIEYDAELLALRDAGDTVNVAVAKLTAGKWNPKDWKGPGTLNSDGRPSLTQGMQTAIDNQKNIKDKITTLSAKTTTPAPGDTKLETNQEFIDRVNKDLNKNAGDLLDFLQKAFKTDSAFKYAFVFEAATGDQKFGKIPQRADSMLCWAPKGTIDKFKVEFYGNLSVSSDIIKKYANSMDLQVNWKSSSSSNHLNYNMYQSIRASVSDARIKAQEAQQQNNEEYLHLTQQLNEGYLPEWKFWDKVKELATSFFEKVKELWNKVVIIFKEAVEKIKSAAADGIEALSNLLGFEMEVTDTLRNQTLKVRI